MIESGFFAVERGKDMLVLGDPRLQLAFGSTVSQIADEVPAMHLNKGAWSAWVVPVWGLGTLFFLGRLGCSWRWACKLKRESRPLPRSYRVQWMAWERRSGIGRSVRLGSSRHIAVPLAVGWRRPAVLLPEGMIGRLAREEIEQVGLHELAHLHRLDDWTSLF
jgi:beta-lactamase regulating signal transducer with metallopeptidase domain